MLIISGYLAYRPEDREDIVAGLIEVAERSRQDSGCVDYWWAEDLEDVRRCRLASRPRLDDLEEHGEGARELLIARGRR